MTVEIKMSGALEYERCDMDFIPAITKLNSAAANGLAFALMEGVDGQAVAFKINNMDTVREIDA